MLSFLIEQETSSRLCSETKEPSPFSVLKQRRFIA